MNIDSMILLEKVMELVEDRGYKIGTSTVTVDEIISFYDEIYKEWN